MQILKKKKLRARQVVSRESYVVMSRLQITIIKAQESKVKPNRHLKYMHNTEIHSAK